MTEWRAALKTFAKGIRSNSEPFFDSAPVVLNEVRRCIVPHTMRTRFSKRFSRFIVFFAFLHAMAPAVVSVVDALAEQGAVRVAQVGEQGSANFRAAHADDCALCAFSAGITGHGEQRQPLPTIQLVRQTPIEYTSARRPNVARPIASQRAPPVLS